MPNVSLELARASQGHYEMVPPDPGGFHRDLWFAIITTFTPSLK